MKKCQYILSLILLANPLLVFAHGEEVLFTVSLEFSALVGVVLSALFVRLNWVGKLVIAGIGMLTIAATDIGIEKLPYSENRTMINIFVVVVPLTVMGLSYRLLKNKFKKK